MTDTDRTDLNVAQVLESGCGCGRAVEGIPALDARQIPPAIRHATFFGALGGLRPGQQMDLAAPHDPLPLLAQIAQREGDAVSHEYRENDPEAWTLRFTRNA